MRGFDVVEPGVFRDPRSGKIYTSVSYRTRKFREKYPTWGVDFKEMPYEGGNGVSAGGSGLVPATLPGRLGSCACEQAVFLDVESA